MALALVKLGKGVLGFTVRVSDGLKAKWDDRTATSVTAVTTT